MEDKENIDVKIKFEKRIDEVKKINKEKLDIQDMLITAKDIAHYHIIGGDTIVIYARHDAKDEDIIAFLIGWALGRILIQRNTIAFHGATVVIDNKAYIIAGKSRAGKSTLTSKFITNGYKFISEEISSIDFDNKKVSYVNPAYCLQHITEEAKEKLEYSKERYFKKRKRYAIRPYESYINKKIILAGIIELTVCDKDEVEFEKVCGSEKLEVFMRNIYAINTYRKYEINSEYFKKCINLVKDIPVFKIKRPYNKFTVDEQMSLILSNC